MKLVMVNGKYLLVGGRPLSTTGGGGAAALTLMLNDVQVGNVLAKPVYQRKAGYDYADVPVLFSYTGGTPSVQARVVNADSNAVIMDWTAITSAQVIDATKTGIGYLPAVPVGADYLLQIRDGAHPGNSATTSNGTRRWGVGICIVLAGQSNMVNTLAAGDYNARIPGKSIGEYDNWLSDDFAGVYFGLAGFVAPQNLPGGSGASYVTPPGWALDLAGGGGSAFLRLMGAALKAKYGRKIPICVIPWAFNQQGLETMTPPSGSLSQVYTYSGTTGGNIGILSPANYTPGDYEGIILHQGEGNNGQSVATRLASLQAYYRAHLAIVAPYGRTAQNFFFRPEVLGVYTQVDQVENLRAAVYALENYAQANNWPLVKAGVNCIDFDTTAAGTPSYDAGLHFKDSYRVQNVRRIAQDAAYATGCVTHGASGPRVSSVTRSGLVATVTIAHDGGTSLSTPTAAAPSGWYANTAADFSGADIAVSAAIASANTVAVTFPSGTVFPAYLKYMGGKVGTMQSQHPDVSNVIYDNFAYPTGASGTDLYTGLPLNPTPTALKVN